VGGVDNVTVVNVVEDVVSVVMSIPLPDDAAFWVDNNDRGAGGGSEAGTEVGVLRASILIFSLVEDPPWDPLCGQTLGRPCPRLS
jgi:hypothetical protein